MNPPKFMTKEEFLEITERENYEKDYVESFLNLAVEVEKAGDGPFDFSHAIVEDGVEVYSFQCSSPI